MQPEVRNAAVPFQTHRVTALLQEAPASGDGIDHNHTQAVATLPRNDRGRAALPQSRQLYRIQATQRTCRQLHCLPVRTPIRGA